VPGEADTPHAGCCPTAIVGGCRRKLLITNEDREWVLLAANTAAGKAQVARWVTAVNKVAAESSNKRCAALPCVAAVPRCTAAAPLAAAEAMCEPGA